MGQRVRRWPLLSGLCAVAFLIAVGTLFVLRHPGMGGISPSEVRGHAPARSVTEAEMRDWLLFTDADLGLSFRRPPELADNLFRGVSSPGGGVVTDVRIYATWGHENGEYFFLTVMPSKLSKNAIPSTFGRAVRVEGVDVGSFKGYRYYNLGPSCGTENYAFPDGKGDRTVVISFGACRRAAERLRPLRDAILSTFTIAV